MEIQLLDEEGKSKWNESYDLTRSVNLWGDESVPFVVQAAELYAANDLQKVIDFPCGDGRNLVQLAKRLPIAVGADSSVNALNISQKLIAGLGLKNCVLIESDIFDSGFTSDQFDGVFCWDVLGHLKNVEAAIGELIRICRKGGIVIGSIFAMGDSTRGDNMRSIGPEEYIYAGKFYFKFYEKDEVAELLSGFDVEILSIELSTWAEPPHEGYREYEHEHQSWVFTIKK
jgi:ubiquinone/menaquinone biosynthesis C-methylase UbiE